MLSERVIEILTLEIDQLNERRAALEHALMALLRERHKQINEQAQAFMAGEADAK